MIDPTTLSRQRKVLSNLLGPAVDREERPATDFEFALCNYYMGGYSFSLNRWCLFAISRLQPVKWDEDAVSKLILEPRKRSLIRTLVRAHKRYQYPFGGLTLDKAVGVVGLLSGSAGGKNNTLTAEVRKTGSQSRI
jgi:hypothetical protein